jgi:hypothetical protein
MPHYEKEIEKNDLSPHWYFFRFYAIIYL